MNLKTHKHVLLYGGTFDPPHIAHTQLPEAARLAIGADAIAYIPSGNQPLKQHSELTPAHHRLAMLRLALQDHPNAHILSVEIDRAATDPTPTYTVDTILALRKQLHPDAKLRLLIGADNLKIFNQWKQPQRIIELAEPLVMLRPPDTAQDLLNSLPAGYSTKDWSPRIVELPQIDASSSQIRQLIAQGQPISHLVPSVVEDYIHEHRLYQRQSP